MEKLSYHWLGTLDDDIVVKLDKRLTYGEIHWNPHFTDPSHGVMERANKIVVNKLGRIVIFTVKYVYNDLYGNHYNVFRITIEKKTETGSWQLIPSGFYETTSSFFGDPDGHSSGEKEKTFEIIADEPKVPFRITAAVLTGESAAFEPGEGSPGNLYSQTREFQIEVRVCICKRC